MYSAAESRHDTLGRLAELQSRINFNRSRMVTASTTKGDPDAENTDETTELAAESHVVIN